MKNSYLKIAGIINLITALVHLVAGQMDLVNPLNNSNLNVQQKAEWVGVWHLVTVLLFFTSYLILKAAFSQVRQSDVRFLNQVGILYSITAIPFLVSSMYFSVLAPQWILLLPIGILLIIGIGKMQQDAK